MAEAPEIDWAASPTLTTIRELIGEPAAVAMVQAFGGTKVCLPKEAQTDSRLAMTIGVDATKALVAHFGPRPILEIPTGRGLGHGRRLTPRKR